MASRIPLLAGNWKMNLDHLEATYFVQKLVWLLRDARFDYSRCEIALMPSFTSLRSVQVLVEADKLKIRYGAQAVSVTTQGALPTRKRRFPWSGSTPPMTAWRRPSLTMLCL